RFANRQSRFQVRMRLPLLSGNGGSSSITRTCKRGIDGDEASFASEFTAGWCAEVKANESSRFMADDSTNMSEEGKPWLKRELPQSGDVFSGRLCQTEPS